MPPLVGDLGGKGIYTLLIVVHPRAYVKVGKLGGLDFSGKYVYTGSATGSGASSLQGRISRHLSRSKKTWWHIDYLLIITNSVVEGYVSSLTTRKSMECEVTETILDSIDASPIKGFGSSDCLCIGHLIHLPDSLGNTIQFVSDVYRMVGLEPRLDYWSS